MICRSGLELRNLVESIEMHDYEKESFFKCSDDFHIHYD